MNRDWRRAAVAVFVWSAVGATAHAQMIDLRPARATTRTDNIMPADTGSAITPPPPMMPPPAPSETFVLLPGRWQLKGAQDVWIPPDTQLRPTEYRSFLPGQYVWRDGRWNWVPAHDAAD
jgi:hypothetical protein